MGDTLDVIRLLGSVGLSGDDSGVCQSVVHSKLLFQVPHLFLVALDQKSLVISFVHDWDVLHLLHTSSESESRHRLLKVVCLGPDIRDKNRVAVTTDRILQHVGKLGLAVRYMFALLVCGTDDDLLQEG